MAVDPDHVLRSLRRTVGEVLSDYDVRFARSEDVERPFAVVQPVGQMVVTGSAYVNDYDQLYEVWIYPVMNAQDDPEKNRLITEQVRFKLTRAFRAGEWSDALRASRVPLYDYTGISWDGALPGAAPVSYMAIPRSGGFNVEITQDPDDASLYSAHANIRLTWSDRAERPEMAGEHLLDYVQIVPDVSG